MLPRTMLLACSIEPSIFTELSFLFLEYVQKRIRLELIYHHWEEYLRINRHRASNVFWISQIQLK